MHLPPIDSGIAADFIFREVDDPMYVLDLETGQYLAVNPAFCRVTGYSENELLTGRYTIDDLVVTPRDASDNKAYHRRKTALGINDDSEFSDQLYHVLLRTRDGQLRMQEVSIKRADHKGRAITLGCMRDITPVVRRQEELQDEARKQREKTSVSFQANVRIMQLTERIIKTPEFTRHIEDAEDLDDMLDRCCTYMVSSQGMEFAHAAIWTRTEDDQGWAISAGNCAPSWPARTIGADEDHPLVHVAGGVEPWVDDEDGDVAVPLRVGDRVDGVMAVRYHPATRELLQADAGIRKSLREVVVTLGDLVGSRANNLRLLDRVRMLTVVDQLTGVYNRRYFDQKLSSEVHRTTRYSRDLTLLILDIDNFKTINDTYGHQQGDVMLAEFGELLKESTRSTDIVCRLGGDEFAILFVETALDNARQKAETLRAQVLARHFTRFTEKAPDPLQVTISAGIAACQSDFQPGDLYAEADAALYEAKDAGKNQVAIRD